MGLFTRTKTSPASAHTTASVRSLLTQLGLSPREIEIYLSLLPLKIARVSAIAKAAKQPRSLTYAVLRKLEEKGLVSESQRGRLKHFVAESPERLIGYAENRVGELQSVQRLLEGALPVFHGLTGPLVGQPRVTMTQGLEGMKQLYRDILSQDFCGMMNTQTMFDTFGTMIASVLFHHQISLKGRDLLVDNAGAKRYRKEWPDTATYSTRLLPRGMPFSIDMMIFADTVALFAYDHEKTIVRIENQAIADSFRSLFEVQWTMSKAR